MIIRMTVDDNDFGRLMNDFVSNFYMNVTGFDEAELLKKSPDEQVRCCKIIRKVSRLLNPNVTEELKEDEEKILIDKIKESFANFVRRRKDEETSNYLISNFKVEIIKTMEDKWENGEVWYWFQHSDAWLNQ